VEKVELVLSMERKISGETVPVALVFVGLNAARPYCRAARFCGVK
jgi:hypothetical protein